MFMITRGVTSHAAWPNKVFDLTTEILLSFVIWYGECNIKLYIICTACLSVYHHQMVNIIAMWRLVVKIMGPRMKFKDFRKVRNMLS